jgi:hypothetical protein
VNGVGTKSGLRWGRVVGFPCLGGGHADLRSGLGGGHGGGGKGRGRDRRGRGVAALAAFAKKARAVRRAITFETALRQEECGVAHSCGLIIAVRLGSVSNKSDVCGHGTGWLRFMRCGARLKKRVRA